MIIKTHLGIQIIIGSIVLLKQTLCWNEEAWSKVIPGNIRNGEEAPSGKSSQEPLHAKSDP